MQHPARALQSLTDTYDRVLGELLEVRGVIEAFIHRGAVVAGGPIIVDVRAATRLACASEWISRLERAPLPQLNVRRRVEPRRARFLPATPNEALGRGSAEYHLEHFDSDRFAFRAVAVVDRPSEALRVRLNRVLPALAALVPAERRFLEALPQEVGYAVLRQGERPDLADAIARRWLELPGLHAAMESEVPCIRGPVVRSGVEARLRLLREECEIIYLAELRPAQPVVLPPEATLTPKQRRVAEYAASGSTVHEISRSMGIAPETVRTHLREIYKRLSVSSRVELFRALYEDGWLEAG